MVNASKPRQKRKAEGRKLPNSKRPHTEPHKPEKKRSRPVTATVDAPAPSGSDSEAEEEFEEVPEEKEDGSDVEMHEEDPKQNDNPKNPNAAKESHQAQKLLQEQRKAAKPHSDLLADSKRIWSLVRQKNIAGPERQKHVKSLMNLVRGKVKDIVFKHDASRIIQSIVKYGGTKERDEVAAELKGKFKELAQNKYSKFLVTKLIRLSSAHRQSILLELQPQVLRLLLHREATSVLADAFELYANAYERSILLREFYGKEATLFTVTAGSSEDKEKAKKGLLGFLEGVDIERKRRVLSSLKENLTMIFNNPDKGAITHAIVHRALWEYLQSLDSLPDEAEQERLRREMFEICQDVLAEMVHTRDGSRAVREFLAYGTAKDRKQILKVFKPHIERMCLDDEAQNVLFTTIDVTDDTKLLAKSLVAELVNVAPKLYTSVQGRRALLYLIMPRSRRHFTPAQIATLGETDEARAKTSKKSPENREAEVRKAASEGLISWVKENANTLIRDPGASLVVTDIMLYADGDKSEAISTLLSSVSTAYPSTDKSYPHHPIDLPHTSRLYKTLLQGGHFSRKTESIEPSSNWDAAAFALTFVNQVKSDLLVAFCVKGERNGTFVVAELCEALVRGEDEEAKDARESLAESFDEDVRKDIEKGEARGKGVLLEKLAAL